MIVDDHGSQHLPKHLVCIKNMYGPLTWASRNGRIDFREFFNTRVFDYLFDLCMNHAFKPLQMNYPLK